MELIARVLESNLSHLTFLFEDSDGFPEKQAIPNPQKNLLAGDLIRVEFKGIDPTTGHLNFPEFVEKYNPQVEEPIEEPKVSKTEKIIVHTLKKPGTAATGTGRKRNYEAMGDEKLIRVKKELEKGEDAYEKSEHPMRDLALVKKLVKERGL